MKNLIVKSLFLLVVVTLSTRATGQEVLIGKRTENIAIRKDSSFVKHVEVFIKEHDETGIYPIFYDAELETIYDIQVHSRKGRHFKPAKKPLVLEDDVELEYIASKKVKSVFIPPGVESKITYTIACEELMYFSDLPFFSNSAIDTLQYQIEVPKTFRFAQSIIHGDSLDFIEIDSVQAMNYMKWNIKAVPVRTEPDPLAFFGIYKNKKAPLMRTIVVPAAYENREVDYMNDWYFGKLEDKRGLNFLAKNKVDELTNGISNPRQIMETLYDYVRENYKYVAVEIGMGAFIPTHANDVYLNKEGDCKDLSNLLSEALNYKGIKSNVALAATYSHISDCDFPSLSSANHVVCLAYFDDETVILDPTDPIHIPDTPVQSIQNRSILIVDAKGGTLQKVSGFTPDQNLISYQIDLKVEPDQLSMSGDFEANYKGISGNFLRRIIRHLGKNKENTINKKHYESVFNNQTVSQLELTDEAGILTTEGVLVVNGKLFNDSGERILFLDFLPRLFETQERDALLEGIHLGSNFSKKVTLRIEMDGHFETFEPIEHTVDNEGLLLRLKINAPADNIIECHYEFTSDYYNTGKENIGFINNTLESFKKIINDPIILKKS
ncbi:transglutaminase-like domain-containing protein [Flagellimonas algicola]|uniref:Transglutaminase domain-containing protein n=1 Tax=Flagellimonas algicola TaxID=2583815 RepID=A0ABY2WLQ5_9FLAO|nr:transglutaminase-like domain-containing protein [Allomuricauda algicola]TMU55560.1 transglutaminase domain-containing protein [Allomuricauda algicola]